MEDLLTNNPLYRFYYLINYYIQDPKTEHLPFVMRPITLILVVLAYNLGCLKYGPKWMEKRQPFKLRNAIIIFDFLQIVVNSFIFYKALTLGWLGHYNFFCGEIDTEDNPHTREIAFSCYLYFLLKCSDMLDTVFMVLRKKNRHVSFLHMYHHSLMVVVSFANAKYMPGGHHTCLGLYNSFVHAIMYMYYLWAALYPNSNLYSFKKLVTKLQMIQFAIIGIHFSLPLVAPNCNYPKWVMFLFIPNNFLMFLLFYDFYRNNYILKKYQTSKPNKESGIKAD